MKAIVQRDFGSPDVLRLEEIPTPAIGDDEVLVRVHAAGVDAGVWHFMAGLPYLARLMGSGVRRPTSPVRGIDVAGTVESVGAHVTGFRPGEEVFGSCHAIRNGAFAEYASVPAQRLASKPASVSFEQAAAVPVSACTALQAVRDKGGVKPEQRVVVTGAGGGVGTFAVQIAKASGAEVTGVCGAAKVDVVGAIGADHVIDHSRADFTDGTRRYDVIVDTAGRLPLRRLRRALEPRGILVIVGGEGGGRWTGGFGRQTIRAPLLSLFASQKLGPLVAKVNHDDLETLRELIETGKITPVIDRTFPLDQAADAVRYQHEGFARGKVVVTI
jgi:NADPH:quinone reductase-like Zn-dependent oxidoreductase